MNKEHWILIFYWLLFGVIHSLTAAALFKKNMELLTGSLFKYYRVSYSLIAFISLYLILKFQFSIVSAALPFLNYFKFITGVLLGIPGIVIMVFCIRKYFYKLSGIAIFDDNKDLQVLDQDGLNRFVRHPLYLGTLLFTWSLLMFFPMLSNLLGCIMMSLYTVIGIYFEEKKLIALFGAAYVHYKRRVPMLIPVFKNILVMGAEKKIR